MSRAVAGFVAGLLFGLGLVAARMIDPAKVLGFLDLAGAWDPSLAFVMLGAIPVAALGFALTRRRLAPLAADRFHLPAARGIDRKLLAGALLFGIGWGLAGYCPGPAVAAVGLGQPATLAFIAAMLAGMALHRLLDVPTRREPAATTRAGAGR